MKIALAGPILALALTGSLHAAPVSISQDFESCTTVASCGVTVTFVADGTATSVNRRNRTDTINTSTTAGFDSFFGNANSPANHFLVIGDISGDISGEPNGQSAGGLSRASFGLGSLAAGSYTFEVGFDYVVDTNSVTGSPNFSPDDFKVLFESANPGGGLLATVLDLSATNIIKNSTPRQVGFSTTVGFSLASASNVFLSFSLQEYNGHNSSAAGIDNLSIMQVPEPGSLALTSLALLGLAVLRRRR